MSASSLGLNRAVTGEQDVILLPRIKSRVVGKRGIIVCHPAGFGAASTVGATPILTAFPALCSALADAGYAVVATDLGGATAWANDAAMTAFAGARTLLATTGCLTDKVLLVGCSMGNLTALRYAADNPGQVAAIAGIVPAVDIVGIRDGNLGSLAAQINTAWGITGTDAVPARGVPLSRGANLAGLRWRGYYSAADTVTVPAGVTSLVSTIGSTASSVQVSTTANHPGQGGSPTDVDSIGQVDRANLLAFLGAHATP